MIKVVSNFVSDEERRLIKDFVASLETPVGDIENEHIKIFRDELKGHSWIFDLSKSEISSYLANFQSSDKVIECVQLPEIFLKIKQRIAETCQISQDNVFLQIIKQDSGGRIKPHYDTGYPGYINYKCNISIQSQDRYLLFIEKDKIEINQSDLYCFEASLYKHWTEAFEEERILLSYAFGLKYSELNRKEDDPRCRMSRRMVKYFQKNII